MSAEDQTPYLIEDSNKPSWLKSKQAKLVAAIIGGTLILGGTFATGVAVGNMLPPQGQLFENRHGFGADRDDHDANRPPHGDDGFDPGVTMPTPPANN